MQAKLRVQESPVLLSEAVRAFFLAGLESDESDSSSVAPVVDSSSESSG